MPQNNGAKPHFLSSWGNTADPHTGLIFMLHKVLTVWLIWYPLLYVKPVHYNILPLKTALPQGDGPSSSFYTMGPY